MWMNVVLLRAEGRRLTAAEVHAARPMFGRLSVSLGHERWVTRRGERTRSALLYDPVAARAFAELHRVELVTIAERGMVLAGVEETFGRGFKNRKVHRQAWWCWHAGQIVGVPSVFGTEPLPDEACSLVTA
jgi:hypothetical protein